MPNRRRYLETDPGGEAQSHEQALGQIDSSSAPVRNLTGNQALKEWLLQKSRQSLKFAHLMFWCILASMDDSQSIQMSQHKNREVWDVLHQLISSHDVHDNSLEYQEDEFFQSFILPKNVPKSSDQIDGEAEASDTGGSSSYNYGNVQKIETHARMVRFDQQMMRALSDNMSKHSLFLSTPKFISDLLFVSEVLKSIEKEDRKDYLKSVLDEINKNLPSNVYIPIYQETTNIPTAKKHRKHPHKATAKKILPQRMHRVLRISTDNAFCLHSKERVPYHVVIEVAYDPVEELMSSDEERHSVDPENIGVDLQSPHQSSFKKQVEKLKNMAQGKKERRFSKDVELGELQRSNSASKKFSRLDLRNKLPIKKFYERSNTVQKNSNSMYVLDPLNASEDLGSNFLNQMRASSAKLEDFDDEELPPGRRFDLPKLKEKKLSAEFKQGMKTLKVYESDKNNQQLEEGIESFEEPDNQPEEDIAGYNIQKKDVPLFEQRRHSEEADEDYAFSSDELEGNKGCLPSISNCIFGKYEHQDVAEQLQQNFSKPHGLFGEKSFKQVCLETQKKSAYGQNKNYGLISVIVKSPDNLTQEQFASQLIQKFMCIFKMHKLKLWLKPFNIIATCPTGGLIETIPDAVSINQLKKQNAQIQTLRQYFILTFKDKLDKQAAQEASQQSLKLKTMQKSQGGVQKHIQKQTYNMRRYYAAKQNFMKSMAGYSLLCYILQIKDRHNGNILLDSKGHMVHVDFGFMLSNSPGNLNFESVTFKLTKEYIDVLGGPKSKLFGQFKQLMFKGFMALREHSEEIISFVEMSIVSGIDLPCFQGRENALKELRDRFKLDLTSQQCREHIYKIIDEACDNWRTKLYDSFQRYSVGIW